MKKRRVGRAPLEVVEQAVVEQVEQQQQVIVVQSEGLDVEPVEDDGQEAYGEEPLGTLAVALAAPAQGAELTIHEPTPFTLMQLRRRSRAGGIRCTCTRRRRRRPIR